MKEEEGGGEEYQVSGDIVQPSCSRALEAVCWDGISNLLDGEVWQLEFVTIGVQQLRVVRFCVHPAVGTQRRQRTG